MLCQLMKNKLSDTGARLEKDRRKGVEMRDGELNDTENLLHESFLSVNQICQLFRVSVNWTFDYISGDWISSQLQNTHGKIKKKP